MQKTWDQTVIKSMQKNVGPNSNTSHQTVMKLPFIVSSIMFASGSSLQNLIYFYEDKPLTNKI